MSSAPSHLRVGIIGAGMIGEPLARLLTEAGHSVKIANSRGPETLADLAQRTGATAATAESAVKDAQLVVVTIPQKAVPQLGATRLISTLSKDVIVIETGTQRKHTLVSCVQRRWPSKDGVNLVAHPSVLLVYSARVDRQLLHVSRWQHSGAG